MLHILMETLKLSTSMRNSMDYLANSINEFLQILLKLLIYVILYINSRYLESF